jgi:Ca2+-binding RTX toxin-like protein
VAQTDLWEVGAGGKGLLNVTKSDGLSDSEATWSPEGGPHIAYVAAKPGTGAHRHPGDLYWMTPHQTNVLRLTKTSTYDEASPTWYPDGGHIAFSRAPFKNGVDGNADIMTIRLYGSHQEDRTPNTPNSDDIQPAWGPDGRLIAFSSNRGGGTYGIYLMTQLGKDVQRLTSDGTQPNWNPDGTKLVFVRAGDIWVMNADGSHEMQLTHHPAATPDANPNFTPDRTRIVFQRGTALYTANLDGTHPKRVPTGGTSSSDPDMQPACNFSGTPHHDVIRGTNRPDLICFSAGGDTIYGKGGNDVIFGGLGGDTIYGGPGNDLIQSGGNHSIKGDKIYGGPGTDFLTGSPLNDYINGGTGDDRLYGWTGDDTLVAKDGVKGNDLVDGGLGRDQCVVDPKDQVYECP